MKLINKYMAVEASSGGSAYFNYDGVKECIQTMKDSTTAMLKAAETEIKIVSYEGRATPAIEKYINGMTEQLSHVKEPLEKMQAQIEEVEAAYLKAETDTNDNLA